MAGLAGDITGILSMMQRNKQLRENKRQFNESHRLREDALRFERDRAEVKDEQWAADNQLAQERVEIDRGRLGVSQGQLAVAEGTLAIAQEQHRAEQDEAARLDSIREARTVYGHGVANDYLNADGSPTANLKNTWYTDPDAEEFTLGLVNRRPERFGGVDFKVTSLDHKSEPGYVILRGENSDGSPGVVTEGGSTDDNDPVLKVSWQDFYRGLDSVATKSLMGTAFQGDDAVEYGLQLGLNQDQMARISEMVEKEALVSEAYSQAGQVDGRNIENVMFNLPEGTEESHTFMRNLATELGIATEQEIQAPIEENPLMFADMPDLQRLERMEAHANNGGGGPRGVDVVRAELEEARRTSTGGTAIAGGRDPKIVNLERELAEAEELYAPLNAARAGQAPEGSAAPQMEPRSFAQLNQDVRAAITNGDVSQQDIARLIDEGYLKPSPEDQARLKQTMQANGIESADQLHRLPQEDAAAAYAVLYAIAENSTERADLNKKFSNLLNNGDPNISYSDVTNRINAEANLNNSRQKPTEDKYLAPAQDWLDDQRKDRREASNETEWIVQNGLPDLLPRIAEARSPGEYRALNYELGVYFDKLYTAAANNDRGLAEKFTSMFGGTSASEDSLDWTNSRLGKGPDGNIYMFAEDGTKLGQKITKEKLRDLGVPVKLFHQFVKIADRNDQARNTMQVGG